MANPHSEEKSVGYTRHRTTTDVPSRSLALARRWRQTWGRCAQHTPFSCSMLVLAPSCAIVFTLRACTNTVDSGRPSMQQISPVCGDAQHLAVCITHSLSACWQFASTHPFQNHLAFEPPHLRRVWPIVERLRVHLFERRRVDAVFERAHGSTLEPAFSSLRLLCNTCD